MFANGNIDQLKDKYHSAKLNYLKALINKDEPRKIEELKNIIVLGEQLNKDVRPDKKKLEILLGRESKNNSKIKNAEFSPYSDLQNNVINNIKIVDNKINTSNTQKDKKDLFYSIKSVYTSNENIIIDFNIDITKDDIKFFKLNQNPIYKNVFDINGYFKDAIPTKLSINGIDKITIGQFKPDVLRIVLSHNKIIDPTYVLNDKQIIISTNGIIEKKENQKNEVKVTQNDTQNDIKNIDLNNSINSVTTQDDKIIIKFNRNYYKKDIKFLSFKNKGKFDNVFDISGKYTHADATKLSIDGIDRIIVTQSKPDILRIRINNMNSSRVNYTLNDKELIIDTQVNSKQKNQQIKKDTVASTPTQRMINKTVVIDAGHGGEDVGAVGPNKRYEKVINFNVSKYLYTILKQRGYKVYLTRTTDKFIKVKDRTVLANNKNADIFISVHTNSVPKEKAHEVTGIETFFLSPARSERAKRVAALENKSDIGDMSNSSKDVFLESLNRPRITASHKLAIDVQAGLLQSSRSKYKDINDSGVREGPFWVLVGAQMPSILIELGYVSHPIESKRLYDKEYQQLLANGIANGVDSYFSKNP